MFKNTHIQYLFFILPKIVSVLYVKPTTQITFFYQPSLQLQLQYEHIFIKQYE